MLEAAKHAKNSFVTLTYAEDPVGGNLVPRDPKLFLKRLRRAVEPAALRYFLCGEYGEENSRPHYHLALFGYGGCLTPDRKYYLRKYKKSGCDCFQCTLINEKWGLGFTDCGDLNIQSAQYICGYVTKKMTRTNEFTAKFLKGRHPEFAVMSTGSGTGKGGLGASAMDDLADVLLTKHGSQSISNNCDVPNSLLQSGRSMPLGRYLRRRLREKVGFTEIGGQEKNIQKQVEEMRDMQLVARENPKFKGKSLKGVFVAVHKGKIASVEGRSKIHKKEKKL